MPHAPFELRDADIALDAVKRVFAWRDEVHAWLTNGRPVGDKMRVKLYALLAGSIEAGPSTFPATVASSGDPVAGLRAILVWRARIRHWLADVGDVMGTPAYDDDDVSCVDAILEGEIPDGVCSDCFADETDPRTHFGSCAAFRASSERARAEDVWIKRS